MQITEHHKHRLEQRLVELIDYYRGIVMDTIESEMGSSPNWKFMRSRLLKALGDRGLSGKVQEILAAEIKVEGVANEQR